MKKYRQACESNIYHITARGVGQQLIFEDNEDRKFLGRAMRSKLEQLEGELYAWCFMGNHVHVLLHMTLDRAALFMQGLLTGYAGYFNKKHGRVGHLFQSRYDSVAIETTSQLLATVRYIHLNPVGEFADCPGEYAWSSYREYVSRPFITTTKFVLGFFDGVDSFVDFHEQQRLDPVEQQRQREKRRTFVSENDALRVAREITGLEELSALASLEKQQRNAKLAELKEAGLTIAQITRITGIGRNIIQRAK